MGVASSIAAARSALLVVIRPDGRGVLGGLLGFAVAVLIKRRRAPAATYDRSYWLINYQAGIHATQLSGLVSAAHLGSLATVPEIKAQWLLTLTLLVAICLLAVAT